MKSITHYFHTPKKIDLCSIKNNDSENKLINENSSSKCKKKCTKKSFSDTKLQNISTCDSHFLTENYKIELKDCIENVSYSKNKTSKNKRKYNKTSNFTCNKLNNLLGNTKDLHEDEESNYKISVNNKIDKKHKQISCGNENITNYENKIKFQNGQNIPEQNCNMSISNSSELHNNCILPESNFRWMKSVSLIDFSLIDGKENSNMSSFKTEIGRKIVKRKNTDDLKSSKNKIFKDDLHSNEISSKEESAIQNLGKSNCLSTARSNNLFKYFCRAEKCTPCISSNDSNILKVEAIVHSPPKEIISPRKSRTVKCILSPTVKLERLSINGKNINEIKVIEEDDFKIDLTSNNNKPEKYFSNGIVRTENPLPKLTPWKMKIKFTSPHKMKSIKKFNTGNLEDITSVNTSEKNLSNDKNIENLTNRNSLTSNYDPLSNKLAPLFYKKPKEKCLNNEAKKNFLESGVPNIIKKKMDEQKQMFEYDHICSYTFPVHNHIQQKNDSFIWNLKNISDIPMKSFDEPILLSELNSDCKFIHNEIKKSKCSGTTISFDMKNEISVLKKEEPTVNVGSIFTSVKRLNEKSNKIMNNVLCWTEKYMPTSDQDILGNTNSIIKLKEWIESYKKLRFKFTGDNIDSDEEFIDSEDSNDSVYSNNNIALLAGPVGCGKTCTVYALANELGFKVLEINAGSNRNGKCLMDKLLEATQSHRVKRSFTDKECKKKVKKKKKIKEDKKTMSLILIEDADILFENCDEGYLSALNSLSSLTKRPIIFIVNSLNYAHLSKYNNLQNLVLKFDYPSKSLINVWLKLIALIEGTKLTDQALTNLHSVAKLDVRKSLLQLQMIVSSNSYFPEFSNEQLFYCDWWKNIKHQIQLLEFVQRQNKINDQTFDEITNTLYKNSTDEFVLPKAKNIEINVKENIKDLNSCFQFLKSVISLESSHFNSSLKYQSSFPYIENSIIYNDSYDSARWDMDIKDYLKNKMFTTFQEQNQFIFKNYYEKTRQNILSEEIAEKIFCNFNMKFINSTAKYCDYLPVIRSIARFESNKYYETFKKNNRYFSYLSSINISLSKTKTSFLCNSLRSKYLE